MDFPIEKNMVNVRFYGDQTTAKMFKSQLKPFDDGVKDFVPGNRILLNKAVKEALFELHKGQENFRKN